MVLKSFTHFAGVWGHYPYFASGYIVVSDFFNGIFSVKLNQPE